MMSAPRRLGVFVITAGSPAPRTGSGTRREFQNYPPLDKRTPAVLCASPGLGPVMDLMQW